MVSIILILLWFPRLEGPIAAVRMIVGALLRLLIVVLLLLGLPKGGDVVGAILVVALLSFVMVFVSLSG